MREVSGEKWRRWILPAALMVGGLVLLAACGGGGDGVASPSPDGEASPQATAQATVPPAASPTGDVGTCPPDEGPPDTGEGGADLVGRISFVRLVFGCSPEIYVMNADGSGALNLSNNEALDDEGDLSPDGEKVVFFSNRDGSALIYVMNADGSGVEQLTEGSGGDTSPRWSPDGSRIAFSRNGSLMVMEADGSDIRIIMEAQPASTAEPCRAGSFVGGWSPDGKRITYYAAVLQSGQASNFWVCAIDADGSNVEVLVEEPKGELHAEPHWSPKGDKIAFREEDGDCSQAGTCDYEVYVLDLKTKELTNVTNNPALDIEPAWSPDGEWIVFASNREDPNFDLYVVRSDGSDLRLLLNDPTAKDSYPSWVNP